MKIKNKLLELWVFNRDGVSLLHAKGDRLQEKVKPLDPLLFTCYLSAIESMAQGCMDAIEMKDSKLLIMLNNSFKEIVLVGRSRPTMKDKKIRETLNEIFNEFFMEYSENLKHWTGEIDQFRPFTEKIAQYCLE